MASRLGDCAAAEGAAAAAAAAAAGVLLAAVGAAAWLPSAPPDAAALLAGASNRGYTRRVPAAAWLLGVLLMPRVPCGNGVQRHVANVPPLVLAAALPAVRMLAAAAHAGLIAASAAWLQPGWLHAARSPAQARRPEERACVPMVALDVDQAPRSVGERSSG